MVKKFNETTTRDPDLVWVAKGDIRVDHSYQRYVDKNKVKRLAQNWDIHAVGAISLSRRTNGLFVIDGQHRVEAAKERSDVSLLPCLINDYPSREAEAAAFLKVNTNRKNVTSVEKHRAFVVTGDETSKYIDGLLTNFGLEINKSGGINTIYCLTCLRRLADTRRDALRIVFPIAVELARREKTHVRERILDALVYIQHYSAGECLQSKKWAEQLMSIGHEELLNAAAKGASFYEKGGAKSWAEGILNVLNKGKRNHFKIITQ